MGVTDWGTIFTEGKIAIRFGTTTVTARKAFAALEERGYIMRRRGSGTYVRKLPERPRQLAMTTRCVIGLVTGENGVDNQLKIGRMIFALHRAIEEAGYLTMLGGENPEALLESGVHGVIVIGRIAGNWVRKLTESGVPVAALYPDPEIHAAGNPVRLRGGGAADLPGIQGTGGAARATDRNRT